MSRKICKRCLNDSLVKDIVFDEHGICNYCLEYDNLEPRLHDYEMLEKLFLNRIDAVKGKYEYDAAVGLSGGKDSVYILYKLVKDYQLKVKAFTLDNGFMSDEAKEKIDRIVKELNVEHEYIESDEALLKKTYKYIVTKYLSPCIACSYLGYTVMINYASKINAGLCIHGRSIPQMLRGYLPNGKDIFVRYIESGLKPHDQVDLETLYTNALSDVKKYIRKDIAEEIENTYTLDAKRNGYREFVPYFLYHRYNKNEIIDFLEKNTSWRVNKEDEHFDCKIHNAAQYIKNITAKRAHITNELSVMIREKTITKEKAKVIAEDSLIKRPEAELNLMCHYIGISKRRLILKAKIYSKRWW